VEEIDCGLLMWFIDKIIVEQKKEENGVDYQRIAILYNRIQPQEWIRLPSRLV